MKRIWKRKGRRRRIITRERKKGDLRKPSFPPFKPSDLAFTYLSFCTFISVSFPISCFTPSVHPLNIATLPITLLPYSTLPYSPNPSTFVPHISCTSRPFLPSSVYSSPLLSSTSQPFLLTSFHLIRLPHNPSDSAFFHLHSRTFALHHHEALSKWLSSVEITEEHLMITLNHSWLTAQRSQGRRGRR